MIFMIGDGFGPASETLARSCANKTELPLDGLLVGTGSYSLEIFISSANEIFFELHY